jgi:hypothetical protein
MGGACSTNRGDEKCEQNFGQRRGRPKRRQGDDIRMDLLGEVRWEGVDWIHPAQNTDQWRTVVNILVP